MRLLRFTAFLTCLALFAGTGTVWAGPDEDFKRAFNTFEYQDYEQARVLLRKLFDPEDYLPELTQQRDAREYLGACEFILGDKEQARKEFGSLLLGWPGHELDPFYYPPDLVQFFEDLRTELIESRQIPEIPKEKLKLEGEEGPVKTEVRYQRETVENRSPILPWIPFGVGQFTNGDNSLGGVFLVTEVGLLATSIASYYLIVDRAAESDDDGASLYSTFWVSQSLLLAVMFTGIGEAVSSFEGTTSSQEEVESLGESSSRVRPALGFSPDRNVFLGVQGNF